jgi:hypothetical protein
MSYKHTPERESQPESNNWKKYVKGEQKDRSGETLPWSHVCTFDCFDHFLTPDMGY